MTRNITLYAKMADGTPVSEGGSPDYVSSVDVDTDFEIRLSQGAAKSDIRIWNVSAGNAEITSDLTAAVSVSDNGIVSGNWEAGQTYRLEVLDNSVRIFYNDVEQDAAVRYYNFTTFKANKTLNLGLSDGLKYIPYGEISDITGNAFNGLLGVTVRQGRSSVEQNTTTGTFTYTEAPLKVGDTLAIFSGTQPNQRNFDTDDDGDVAYMTVIAVEDDTTYTYQSAKPEDVLFTPDVLPVPVGADQDGDPGNHSITVDASVLDFSDDKYTQVGLDATTTVDVGDFIVFYTGSFGSEAAQDANYARITAVTRVEEGDVYLITYTDQVTQADIMGAMDIYNTREVSGEELLENVNVGALEAKLTAQAQESGFVEEATQYLAALALETDGFQQLRDDMNLKSYSFHLEDGTPLAKGALAKASAPKVRIEAEPPKFIITPRLEHFTDHSTGLRAELSLSFQAIVNPDSDNQIHISVVAIFEQEVLLGLNVSGGAIWKWKWIFPYIYDYRLNANIDVGTFTGIGITATAMSKTPQAEFDWDEPAGDAADQQIVDIGRQIKELMDAPDEFFGESAGTNGGSLLEKYAAMLESESDWVELYNAELFSNKGSVDPFHILAYELSVNFVVSANINVTLGMTFQYGNAKRYNFSLLLFHNQATTETIDLETEHYQFDFYVMGTMGIRAGIRMELSVGLFSTDLASIGVSAEVGAYAQLWGYFYYSLSWEKGQNKESRSSGALFIEVGIYLEVGFLAQALKGTFSYNPTLYEKQWPLWWAGQKENVYDFAYSQATAPTLKMVGMTTTLAIPSTVFQMKWMDLTSGEISQGSYEPDRFRIAFSNPAFRYDAATGRIICTPPERSVKQTTEMRVTWGGAPMAFTSKPIERVLQVEWTDPQNAKYITFDTNGGSTVDAIVAGPGESITLPTATRQGYDFGGWYYNDNGVPRSFATSRMPEESLEVFAQWNPKTNTPYKVECYTQEVSGSYTLYDTVTRQGTTDDYVEINGTNAPVFSHFTYDYPTTANNGRRGGRIAADGSLVLKIYYKRDNYTATFTYGAFSEENEAVVITKPYGATIYVPQLALGGYLLKDFGSGTEPGTPITLTGHMTFHARWEPDPNTPYRVEHYVQSVSGDKYLLLGGESGIISGFGATGDVIPFADYKLTIPGLVYQHVKVAGEIVDEATISPSGNTVVKLHYDRAKYPLQWSIVGTASGTLTGGDSGEVTFGKLITPPVVTPNAGYRFDGWYADAELTGKVDFEAAISMPAQPVTYYGRFVPESDTLYKVEHYLQEAENPNLYVKVETEELYAETESSVIAQAKSYPHFVENTTHLNRKAFGQVAGDGSLVLRLYYNRETHDALFVTTGGSDIAPVSYRYEQTIQTPAAPTREGYDFAGWSWEGQETPATSLEGVTMGETDMTFTAHWTAKSYTISYDLGGGGLAEGASNPEEYTIETDSFTLANPGKTGYTFTGWTWGGQALPQETVTISLGSVGNRSYTANWQANTYTVFFHAGDEGTVTPDSKNVTFDATYGVLPTPTRTGYTFDGWFTEGGEPVTADTAVTAAENQTLYARWAIKRPTITFSTSGGSEIAPITQDYNTPISKPADPTREGYTFTGWDRAIPDTMPVDSMTINATWQANTYTVSFHAGAGTVGQASKEVTYDSPYGTLPTPTYTGYSFQGWYLEETFDTQVTNAVQVSTAANHTLYARWSAAANTAYRVEYYQQNADNDNYTLVSLDTKYLTGTTGSTVTAPAKTYTYFTENTDHPNAQISGAIAADGSLVLRRYYNRNTYQLEFKLNDEEARLVEGSLSQTLRYGQTIDVPELECPDKNFLGWYENAAGTGEAVSLTTMPGKAMTLYAKWAFEQISYTVKHYVMGTDGSYPGTSTRTQTKTTAVRTELTLADLKDNTLLVSNGISYSHAKVQGGTVLKAEAIQGLEILLYYQRSTYTLTWNFGGGADPLEQTLYYGASIVPPEVEARTGYTSSWGSVSSTMPAYNVTYNLSWTAKQVTVTFHANGGTVTPASKKFTYDQTYASLPTPVREGHQFLGWYLEGTFETQVDSDAQVKNAEDHFLYAKWETQPYTVKFMDEVSDETYYEVTALYGTPVSKPADPTRTGYDFLGWDKTVPVTVPGQNLTLYAVWQAQEVTYTVQYKIEDPEGGWDEDTQSFTATTGSTVSLGDPMGGSEFQLVEAESVTSAIVAGDGSTQLVLVYVRNTYQATFTTEYGEFEEAGLNGAEYVDGGDRKTVRKVVPAGGNLAVYAPVPTYPGHTVTWMAQESETGYALTSEAAYTANWTPVQHTVTFVGSGHTGGDMTSVTYTYGVAGQLPFNEFIRAGYDFTGWNTKEDGTGTAYADGAAIHNLLADLTLYAQWQIMTRRVTFDANGGSGDMPAMNVVYGQPAQQLLTNAFTREYYTFTGWNTRANGTGTAYAEGALISNLTEDLTLYAQWSIGKATLTFVTGEGGTPIAPITRDYFAAVTPPANPTRSGYVFDGWDPAIPTTMPAGNLTITAKWLPGVSINLATGTAPSGVTYPVSYNPSDTVGAGYVIVEEDMIPTHPKSLTFVGWAWAGQGELPAGVTIDGTKITLSDGVNVPLYFKAQWRVSIKLTFTIGTAEGLTSGQAKTYLAGTPLPVLEREHWTFKGWYDSSTGQYFTDAPYSNYNSYGSPGLEEAWELCEIYQENISDLKLAGNNKAAIRLQEDITLSSPGGYLSDLDITGLYNDLDGNNKTITITNPNRSLFAKIQPGGTVSNLTVVLANPMVQPGVFGIFSKYNSGTIRNCKVYGTFTCTNTFDEYAPSYVGGFVGYNYGLIENCENHADITSQNGAGGIAGQNANEINSQRTGSIVNCRNYGTITGHNRVGGIVGYLSPGYSSYGETIISTVDNCTNYGIVTYDLNDKNKDYGQKIGGIVGEASVVTAIINCTQAENNGNYVRGTTYVGGIVGYANDCTLTGCTAETLVSGWTAVGGIAGYAWTVTDCHFTGTLEKDYTGYMGTIVGHAEYKNQIINCTSTFEGGQYGRFNH